MVEVVATGLRRGDGRPVRPGRRLGLGGQGEVWTVDGDPDLVLKRYLPAALTADPRLPARLAAMTAVGGPPPRGGHPVLAWPASVVTAGPPAHPRLVGFLMPRVDLDATAELHEATNPDDRAHHPWLRRWTWAQQVHAAAALSGTLQRLHDRGIVVGDLNERNILLWPDASVTLIDCDSLQLADPAGGPAFLCRVGRPELTAPELTGRDLSRVARSPSSDVYALASHVHQLLLQGEHPFRGVWTGAGEKPSVPELAAGGRWIHGGDPFLRPRPACPPLTLLGPVAPLLEAALVTGARHPAARPSAGELQQALDQLAATLVACPRGHRHPSPVRPCPWCALDASRSSRPTLPANVRQPERAARTHPPRQPATVLARPTTGTRTGVTHRPVQRTTKRKTPWWRLIFPVGFFVVSLLVHLVQGLTGSASTPFPTISLPPVPVISFSSVPLAAGAGCVAVDGPPRSICGPRAGAITLVDTSTGGTLATVHLTSPGPYYSASFGNSLVVVDGTHLVGATPASDAPAWSDDVGSVEGVGVAAGIVTVTCTGGATTLTVDLTAGRPVGGSASACP